MQVNVRNPVKYIRIICRIPHDHYLYSMKELLESLRKMIAGHTIDCYFNEPVEPGAIEKVEMLLDINFPSSYKKFLQAFNGGFISLLQGKEGIDVDTLAWNSNEFLSAGAISEAYGPVNEKTEYSTLPYRYIPFLHTFSGEYLGFRLPLEEGESKVYDLWHEAPASEWAESVVYESFEALLRDYLEKNGMIAVM